MPSFAEKRKSALEGVLKGAVYEAARELVVDHGLEGVTMDRVAEAAGVAKGTLYNYFANKDALLLYVMETASEPIDRETQGILKTDIPPSEKMERMLLAILHHIEREQVFFRMLHEALMLSASFRAAVKKKLEMFKKTIATIIGEGIDQGCFRPVDPLRAATLLNGAMEHLVFERLNRPDECPSPEQDVADFMTLFFSGLSVEPESMRPTTGGVGA